MKLLIVYEDECPYNPIVYVGKFRESEDLWDALKRLVKSAVLMVGIDTDEDKLDDLVEETVYDLCGMANYTWVREHWCFAIKEVAE